MFPNADTGFSQRTKDTHTQNPCSFPGTFQKASNLTLLYFVPLCTRNKAALGGRSDVIASLWEQQESSSRAELSDIRKSLADRAISQDCTRKHFWSKKKGGKKKREKRKEDRPRRSYHSMSIFVIINNISPK